MTKVNVSLEACLTLAKVKLPEDVLISLSEKGKQELVLACLDSIQTELEKERQLVVNLTENLALAEQVRDSLEKKMAKACWLENIFSAWNYTVASATNGFFSEFLLIKRVMEAVDKQHQALGLVEAKTLVEECLESQFSQIDDWQKVGVKKIELIKIARAYSVKYLYKE